MTHNAEKERENASIQQLLLDAERKMHQAKTQEQQREEELEVLRAKIEATVKEVAAARENEKNAVEIAIRKVDAIVAQVIACSGPSSVGYTVWSQCNVTLDSQQCGARSVDCLFVCCTPCETVGPCCQSLLAVSAGLRCASHKRVQIRENHAATACVLLSGLHLLGLCCQIP